MRKWDARLWLVNEDYWISALFSPKRGANDWWTKPGSSPFTLVYRLHEAGIPHNPPINTWTGPLAVFCRRSIAVGDRPISQNSELKRISGFFARLSMNFSSVRSDRKSLDPTEWNLLKSLSANNCIQSQRNCQGKMGLSERSKTFTIENILKSDEAKTLTSNRLENGAMDETMRLPFTPETVASELLTRLDLQESSLQPPHPHLLLPNWLRFQGTHTHYFLGGLSGN